MRCAAARTSAWVGVAAGSSVSGMPQLRELERQARPAAGVLVLEVDVDVAPRLGADALDPAAQRVAVVGEAAQAQVTPAGGGDDRRRLRILLVVGGAQRPASLAQRLHRRRVVPRR